jgi:hypothetical protein
MFYIFKKLKDAYDRRVLIEERFNQLNQKLDAANKRIEILEAIVKKPAPSKFAFRACDIGTYRPAIKPMYMQGVCIGDTPVWECDKCKSIADPLLAKTLSS